MTTKRQRSYLQTYGSVGNIAKRMSQTEKEAARTRGGRTRQREGTLSKPEMFHLAGCPLSGIMTTGNELFDDHLGDFRLNDFGNVMHLHAAFWSDISAQFMHGFPQRLITDSHRGILPGNIAVAARISNQAVWSLSIGKMNGPHAVHIYTGTHACIIMIILCHLFGAKSSFGYYQTRLKTLAGAHVSTACNTG